MAELELRALDEPAVVCLYRRELRHTFPPSERKPLGTIRRHMAAGNYPVWGLFQGEELAAYALLWQAAGERISLLDYLGVPAERRDCGYGSEMLSRLIQVYGGRSTLLAEVEAPESDQAEERLFQKRRLDFYRRAGFRYAGFDCRLFGVHYHMLAAGSGGREELLQAYRGLYQGHLPRMLYRKFAQIPWKAGPWDEKESCL